MFLQVYEYGSIRRGARWFRPGVYGLPQLDGLWGGWLIFFPSSGEPAVATERETTQPTLAALTKWAEGLPTVYVDGALDRALTLAVVDKPAAEIAREGAQQLGHQHVPAREAFAPDMGAAAVKREVEVHERVPRVARAEAADADRRPRCGEAKATPHGPGQRSATEK